MAKSPALQIPVGVAFERRLAELVWEHCPALARETAAGKMAMELELDGQAVQDIIIEELRPSIKEWAALQVEILRGKLSESLDVAKIVEEEADSVRAEVQASLGRNTNLDKDILGLIHTTAMDEVIIRVRRCAGEVFGTNDESLHKMVVSRIDAYLERRLDVPETHRAIADGMHKMVAASDG